jgi:hypothetical protein
MQDIDEIVQTIDRLQGEFEDLAVRGLRTAGTAHLGSLETLREEFERIGADHLAGRIAEVVAAIRNDDRGAAAALLRAQASLRVFERVLSLEAAGAMLEALQEDENDQDEDEEEEEG